MFHKSHRKIRSSNSSQYDFICEDCGATDLRNVLDYPCTSSNMFTGCYDKDGEPLLVNDIVVAQNVNSSTKPEYWYPVYKIIFDPPCFTLKHIGGGKDGGNHNFMLKYRNNLKKQTL